MAIEDLIQDATRRMHKSVEAAQSEFATLRTGRASVAEMFASCRSGVFVP